MGNSVSSNYPPGVGSPYTNLIGVKVTSKTTNTSEMIVGSVFGSSPHVVQIAEFSKSFSFKVDLNQKGSMVAIRNADQPGFH